MKKIDYKKIIKTAFIMNWHKKTMWFFGFFIFLSQPFLQFNSSSKPLTENESAFLLTIEKYLQSHPAITLLAVLFLIFLICFFIIMGLISRASIIKTANNFTVYRQANFKSVFSETKKYLWKFLILDLLMFSVLLLLSLAMFAPVIYMFSIKSEVLGTITLLISVIFMLALIILALYLIKFSQIYIVTADIKIKDAIESAYDLFEKNLKQCLFFGVITLLLNIAIIIPLAVAIIFIFLISLPIGFILSFLLPQSGTALTVIILTLLIISSSVVIMSWLETFLQTVWVLFFQQIALQKRKHEKKKELVLEAPLPDPEAA